MHLVVTGGAGFIGSHLCDALIAQDYQVTVVDNLSSGKRQNLSPSVKLIEADCADLGVIEPLVEQADGVFHLAAIASVPQSVSHWLQTSLTNQFATIAWLEAISKRLGGVIPFVYASSAAVYGETDASFMPIKETTPTHPLTPYGADKLGSEQHAAVARAIFQIPTLGLRFFNVYGPRQDPSSPYSGVISIFAQRLLAGQDITMFGDGQQSRDFVYVADVVEHLMTSMLRLQDGAIPAEAALNVCGGHEVTIQHLAETIAAQCQIKPTIHHAPPRDGDIRRSVGDPARASHWLGCTSTTSLEDGLGQTLDWMQQQALSSQH